MTVNLNEGHENGVWTGDYIDAEQDIPNYDSVYRQCSYDTEEHVWERRLCGNELDYIQFNGTHQEWFLVPGSIFIVESPTTSQGML